VKPCTVHKHLPTRTSVKCCRSGLSEQPNESGDQRLELSAHSAKKSARKPKHSATGNKGRIKTAKAGHRGAAADPERLNDCLLTGR